MAEIRIRLDVLKDSIGLKDAKVIQAYLDTFTNELILRTDDGKSEE